MRSKCIKSTSGRKAVIGNGFSDIGFLCGVESLAVRRCFRLFFAIFLCASALSTMLLLPVQNLTLYLNLGRPFSYKRGGHFGRSTPFLATFVTMISAHLH